MFRSTVFEPKLRPASDSGWRARWFRIIFRHDARDERIFDVCLLWAIAASVLVAILDSVAALNARYGDTLYQLEWAFTLLFSIEYVVRLLVVRRPLAYMRSFYGVIDLAAALPTYLSLLLPGAEFLIVIRILRVMRVFRIFELVEYSREGTDLLRAIHRSRRKIGMFLLFVVLITVVFGAVMYLVEGRENGFTSIPRSMYWAIVTLATVGFGDITPKTGLGQFITSIIVLIGYGVIAVPTGIFSSELTRMRNQGVAGGDVLQPLPQQRCPRCGEENHLPAPRYCHRCGEPMHLLLARGAGRTVPVQPETADPDSG